MARKGTPAQGAQDRGPPPVPERLRGNPTQNVGSGSLLADESPEPGRAATIPFTGAPPPSPPQPSSAPGWKRARESPFPDELDDVPRFDTAAGVPRWITYSQTGPIVETSAPKLRPGVMVPSSRYRVVRWLGEGGMGVVYEAEHVDIERRVALKILRSHIDGRSEPAQQFRSEARAASKVGSRNIAEVYDFAELDDGRLMFAMELLRGPVLIEELMTGPLEPARCIAIVRQACKGLAAAHRKGIVHRDIKPENIVLVKEGARPDMVKIVDFGISTILTEGMATDDRPCGTPHYLAPEIISGKPFDQRVDIYALGCTAYEMLVGRPPFSGRTVREILDSHLDKEPLAPSELNADAKIHPRLDAVILKALAKNPEDRYFDMSEFEADLCEAQIEARLQTNWDDLPLPDIDPERRERLLREMPDPRGSLLRRRWVWPIVASLSLVAVAVLTTVLMLRPDAVVQERSRVENLVISARAAAARSYYVYPPFEKPNEPTAYNYVLELEGLEATSDLANRRATELRDEFANTLTHIADDYWNQPGGKAFAVQYYAQVLFFDPDNEVAGQRASITPQGLEELRQKAATKVLSEAEVAMATPHIEMDVEEIDAVEDEPPKGKHKRNGQPPDEPAAEGVQRGRQNAANLARRGRKALRAGRTKTAEELFGQALDSYKRNPVALIGLSDIYFNRGDYGRAVRYAKKAVAAAPYNGSYRIRLGDAYYKVRKFRDAKDQYLKATRNGKAREAKWRIDKVNGALGG